MPSWAATWLQVSLLSRMLWSDFHYGTLFHLGLGMRRLFLLIRIFVQAGVLAFMGLGVLALGGGLIYFAVMSIFEGEVRFLYFGFVFIGAIIALAGAIILFSTVPGVVNEVTKRWRRGDQDIVPWDL